ncbi:hypothetical protein LTR09_004854 [Extremus antarcticus]|uniref:FAD-binding domain-containing protein n=1 Tax=Extremus antarcticus TaxID=702011 RepID=A0AAJ0DNX5_9PEZI|nr:hypothetical protein LTR09_004854 [Extremus antarcticus]
MNFAGIHPDDEDAAHSEVKHAQDLQDLKLYKLLYRPPLSRWTKGRACLIGDAAHPMLPHQGQGGGMSIEDAGALGVLLSDVQSRDAVPARLELFQSMRYSRASAVQIFSNYGQDQAHKMEEEARPFCSGKVPTSQAEFHQWLFSYDVLQDARDHLASSI